VKPGFLSRPAAKAEFSGRHHGTAEAVPYKDFSFVVTIPDRQFI
jgi:hypothetical protein